MIFKKIKNPKKSATAATRIARLSNYLRAPESGSGIEKCTYSGVRNFFSDTPGAQVAEMIALAAAAPRSKDPINHYALSWRAGEHPTTKQIDEAVDFLVDELGAAGLQMIYSLHVDTKNDHLHLMINRVDPASHAVRRLGGGWDIRAGHRAIARIEHAQGWTPEAGARYHVTGNGNVEENKRSRDPQPNTRARDAERRSGQASAQRIAQRDAAPIIAAAKNWADLHARLGEEGMRYEQKGSGAVIYIGDTAIKASQAGRAASLAQLQKRLGLFQPAPEGLALTPRPPEPVRPDLPRWPEYTAERAAAKKEKDSATLSLSMRHDAEREELRARVRDERARARAYDDWRARRAMASVLAARAAAARAAMIERHRQERHDLQRQQSPFPGYEEWLRAQGRHDLADQFRQQYRPAELTGAGAVAPVTAPPRDIRNFTALVQGGGRVAYIRNGREAFIDRGRVISISAVDRENVRAALQVAAAKWGVVKILSVGPGAEIIRQIARENKIKLADGQRQEKQALPVTQSEQPETPRQKIKMRI